MILLSQPSKHLLVEFQIMKTGVGFQYNEISKLLLDDVGLQVHDILLDIVANLRDVANVFNWGTHWIDQLDMSLRIKQMGCLQNHAYSRNRVDFVISGERHRHFQLQVVRSHFRSTEHETVTCMCASPRIRGATRWIAAF